MSDPLVALYDRMHDVDEDVLKLKRKLWLFEWFLFFLMIYMCYIAYNLYNLNWDVIEATHAVTSNTQFIFP